MTDHADRKRYVVGRRPVFEALQSGAAIEKIFMVFGSDDPTAHRLRAEADRRGVSVATMDRRKFGHLERELRLEKNTSQGVIALRPPRDPLSLGELVGLAKSGKSAPLLVAMDGITDPHNLGAIARSAEAAGATGLILTEAHSAPVTPVAVKASAGALEHLPIAKVQRMSTTLASCKEDGFTIVGSAIPGEETYTEVSYDGPTIVVVGSEGEGLHRRVLDECTHVVSIPMAGKIDSLNASVAAGILLFEVVRQRTLET